MDAARNDQGRVSPDYELEAMYNDLVGKSAPEGAQVEIEGPEEFYAYALVREVAEEYPSVARQAARDGTAAHYRGDDPFGYSVSNARGSGEVVQ